MKRDIFVVEKFDGVDSFLSTLSKREPNSVFSKYGSNDKQNSHDDDYNFRGTRTFSEACDIMATGFAEGLKDLQSSKAGVRVKTSSNATRNMPQADVVGFTPHVPNAIAGIPQSMISVRRVQQKSKTVSIIYDMGASCSVDKDEFVVAGRHLMDLITAIELQGYRVQLDILQAFCTSSQMGFCIIRVKNHRQPINPLKLSYLLLHPSFFRRHAFNWLETCPEITYTGFSAGYGHTLRHHVSGGSDTNKLREYLAEKHILDDGVFYTNFYEAERCSSTELAKKMGLTLKK